jgi:acyl dehydratase
MEWINMRTAPFLFADFEPGAMLGEHAAVYDAELVRQWRLVFAADGDPSWLATEAAGISVALLMRSYLAVVSPRPPGNIHAGQKLRFASLPKPGENVQTRIACIGKEIRRERRYVELDAVAKGEAGRALYAGRLLLVWAK